MSLGSNYGSPFSAGNGRSAGIARHLNERSGTASSLAPCAAGVSASMDGAFMLMRDGNFIRDVTGPNREHFPDEALESHPAWRPTIGKEKGL